MDNIQSIILTVLSVGLGVSVIWTRAEKVLRALKELGEVLTAITEGFSDKKLTEEEVARIKKETGEALAAFKAIIK